MTMRLLNNLIGLAFIQSWIDGSYDILVLFIHYHSIYCYICIYISGFNFSLSFSNLVMRFQHFYFLIYILLLSNRD